MEEPTLPDKLGAGGGPPGVLHLAARNLESEVAAILEQLLAAGRRWDEVEVERRLKLPGAAVPDTVKLPFPSFFPKLTETLLRVSPPAAMVVPLEPTGLCGAFWKATRSFSCCGVRCAVLPCPSSTLRPSPG